MKRSQILAGILSFLTIFIWRYTGYPYFGATINPPVTISALAFVLIYILYLHGMKSFNKREIICFGLLGAVLSACWVTGRSFQLSGFVGWKNPRMYLCIFLMGFVAAFVLSAFAGWMERHSSKVSDIRLGAVTGYLSYSKKNIILGAGILLLFWIPAFLAMFPGNYAYDAQVQMLQVLLTHKLNAIQPVLHTLFLSGCLKLGHAITGDYNTGIMIHSIVQACLMAGMQSYICFWLGKLKAPRWFIAVSLLFFAVNPYNQILVFSTTKDVLFCGVFLLFVLKSSEMFLFTEKFFSKKSNMYIWCAQSLLMCFLRSQGIYILLLMVPFLVFRLRRNLHCVIPMFAACFFVFFFVTGPIYTLSGIEKGDMKEALSVPIQQLSRTLIQKHSDVGDKDKNIIYNVIPSQSVEKYKAFSADPVKSDFKTDVFKKNAGDFFKAYIRIGLKNPSKYLNALYGTAYSYWYPDHVQLLLFYDGSFVEQAKELIGLKRNTLFPLYDRYLRAVSNTELMTKVPAVSFLLAEATPFWILLFLIALSVYKRKYIFLFVLPPILGYWGTLILGPVTLMRYAYPLMSLLPFLIVLIWRAASEEPRIVTTVTCKK